jgi:hypothetical protein
VVVDAAGAGAAVLPVELDELDEVDELVPESDDEEVLDDESPVVPALDVLVVLDDDPRLSVL